MANTGKDGSGSVIYLRKAFGTGVDDTNAYTFGSALYFQRNSAEQLVVLDTSTPANNRGMPVVLLSGPAAAPFDVNSGAASATTLRVVPSTRSEAAPTPLAVRLSNGTEWQNTTSWLTEALSVTSGTSTASGVFVATSAKKNKILKISVYNSSTTSAFIDWRDGTAGSVIWRTGVPALSWISEDFPYPGLVQPTANTALAYDPSAAISTLYINLLGYQEA